MGAKREYCTQYFKAFDHNQDGFVDYQEFLLGVVAMVRPALLAGWPHLLIAPLLAEVVSPSACRIIRRTTVGPGASSGRSTSSGPTTSTAMGTRLF